MKTLNNNTNINKKINVDKVSKEDKEEKVYDVWSDPDRIANPLPTEIRFNFNL